MRIRNNDDQVEAELGWDSNNQISLDSPVKATSMNLVPFSEDFSNSAWDKNLGNISSGESDPNGGTNASKFTPTTGSGFHYFHDTFTVVSGKTYTYSIHVKADGYNFLMLNAPAGNAAGNAGPKFNLSTGQKDGFLTTDHDLQVEQLDDGWYRISTQYTTIGTALRIDHNVLPTNSVSGYSGDGTSGVLFWGSQLEETVYESTGTEKVTNGTFDTDLSSWVKSDASGNETVEVDNGRVLMRTVSGDYIKLEQAITFEAGKQYTLSGDVSYVSGSGVVAYKGSALIADNLNSNTTFSFTTTQATTASELFRITRKFISSGTASASEVYLDNLSVLEYSPKVSEYTQTPVISDAHNSTSATNLREFCGLENIFPYSVRTSGVSASLQWSNGMSGTDFNFNATSPTGSQDA